MAPRTGTGRRAAVSDENTTIGLSVKDSVETASVQERKVLAERNSQLEAQWVPSTFASHVCEMNWYHWIADHDAHENGILLYLNDSGSSGLHCTENRLEELTKKLGDVELGKQQAEQKSAKMEQQMKDLKKAKGFVPSFCNVDAKLSQVWTLAHLKTCVELLYGSCVTWSFFKYD